MLRVEDLHTYYGAIHALKGISLHVDQGEVVCLIGSNGIVILVIAAIYVLSGIRARTSSSSWPSC